jgi:hypothetical protein
MQRLLGLQRHRSSNCAGRGTEFDRCESPSRISLSRSLQHHTEPTPNICEKEIAWSRVRQMELSMRSLQRSSSSPSASCENYHLGRLCRRGERPTVFTCRTNMSFNLEDIRSCSEIPACRDQLAARIAIRSYDPPIAQSWLVRKQPAHSTRVSRPNHLFENPVSGTTDIK